MKREKKIIRTVTTKVIVTCQSMESTSDTIEAAQDFIDSLTFASREMIDAQVEVQITPEILI